MVKTFQPNRAFSLVLIIGLAVAIFIIYHSRLFSKIADPSRIVDDDNVWKDTPSLSIMTRAYAGSCMEFYNEFLVGYLLFFPYQKWANSDVVIVLDDESELDHRLGTVLAHLPPYPKVKYEPVPSETTFCDGWRRVGYSRQQYSNFYSDLYSSRDYIGIVDTDSYFATPVAPEDLFVDGKPRLFGYNGCCTGWSDSLEEAIGGGYSIGEFMVVIGFPVMVKREHFSLMRDHITRRMGASSFEQAFNKICTKYNHRYSQFDLIAHYLWFHHRDEYSWHLNDWAQSKHPAFKQRMSERDEVLQFNRPIIGLMKHGNHLSYSDYLFKYAGDYLCLASQNAAGSCKKFFSSDTAHGTLKNLFVDWQFKTADWERRGMQPGKPPFQEEPWAKPGLNYTQVYQKHLEDVKKRNLLGNTWKFLPAHDI